MAASWALRRLLRRPCGLGLTCSRGNRAAGRSVLFLRKALLAGLHGELVRVEPKQAHLVGLGGHRVFPEKVVEEQILGPRALLGVQHQHGIDKVDAEIVGEAEDPAETFLGGARKGLGWHHKATTGKFVVALPNLLGRRATQLGNLEKLVQVVLSL